MGEQGAVQRRHPMEASTTTTTTETPHILVVSFPGQGHINPLLRFAKRVAAKGALVTLSSTHDMGHRILHSSNLTPASPIPIGRGHLRFEFFSDGWPVDDPRRQDLDPVMANLSSAGALALADLIRRQADQGRPVDCLVNNPFIPWALDVASDLSVPSAVLWVQSCAVFSTYYHYHRKLVPFPTRENPDVRVTLPGLPTLLPGDLPTFLLPSNPYTSLTDAILAQFENLAKASWVFANSFLELENDVIEALSDVSPVIPVGPLVDAGGQDPSSQIRTDLWKAADDCMEWLDGQQPVSVVYVSVGSVVILTKEEVATMAEGLNSTGRPFLWILRENFRELLPEGFEKSTEGRGKVVEWSPQERVLGHVAMGCFVTHCGWNSTLETLAAGVAVVAYPQWGDQVPDAKLLVDGLGVGVRLSQLAELAARVEEVMAGPRAEEMRDRARGWREKARVAAADGGSSDKRIQEFVEEVRKRMHGGE